MGCAIALENIRLIEAENLAARAAESGAYLLEGLQSLSHHACFGGVRRKGMLIGLELVLDKVMNAATTPPGHIGKTFRLACRERGLILLPIHPGNVMLIAPPLNLPRTEIDQLINIIDGALADTAVHYQKG